MALHFFNTLTRRKEAFKEIEPGKVRFYSCGPTVYNYAHIGNFRAFLTYDLLKRYLLYRGYRVKHVMNLTDVGDKTIRDSRAEGVPLEAFTERYTQAFFEDMETLNILPADLYPRATGHIPEMVEMTRKLIDDGFAYVKDGSVYFAIGRFSSYGALAHLDFEGMQTGASGVDSDEYEKENARDFALWKAWQEEDGEVSWETELGRGRPGWHLECSCMSMKYLGETVDIHAGGVDLVFPHHQNEIAQSEAATGKRFVNYWLHNEFVNINNEKMSKSLGNFFTLRDIVKSPDDARGFRYLMVASHYRMPLNFTMEALDGAKNALRHLTNFRSRLAEVENQEGGEDPAPLVEEARAEFIRHMDDDLNSPRAVAALFGLVSDVEGLLSEGRMDRKGADLVDAFVEEIDRVLGVFYRLPEDDEEETLPEELQALIAERETARKERNWARSDEIRDQFAELGYVLEDTAEGTVWKRK